MKKFFATILMLLYLIPAIGVNVSAHFCGEELASLSHAVARETKCFCGSRETKKPCCEDKQVKIKIDDNQQKAELLTQKFSNPFHIQFTIPAVLEIPYVFKSAEPFNYSYYNPPNRYKQPIYLLNRVFRI